MDVMLSSGVIGGLAGGLAVLLLGLALRATRRPPPVDAASGAVVLRYHFLIRALSVPVALFPLALVVLLFVFPPKDRAEVLAAAGVLVGFTLAGAFLLLETWLFRVIVTDQEVIRHSPWRRPVLIPWDEVVEVSYSRLNSWFVLTASDGRKVRVAQLLSGVPTFAARVQRHLRPEVYADARAGFEALGVPADSRPRRREGRWSDRARRGGDESVRPPGDEFREGDRGTRPGE
jgi:hypothetical protein